MFLSTILPLNTIFKGEFLQIQGFLITLVSLYGIIFYLLTIDENKKYFQNQR